MSNRSDRRKEEELRRRNAELAAESQRDRQALRERTPEEIARSEEVLAWNAIRRDPNRDYSKVPGVAFDLMGEEGAAGAEEERTALGAMRFGAANADPNLQAVLKANIQERRAQRRGRSLESAVNRYDMLMRGLGSDVVSHDLARRQGLAGMTTSAGANALNQYSQFQVRPHWGLSLATAGIGALGGLFKPTISDERLKDNIKPVGEKLKKIRPVTWEWKDKARAIDPSKQGSDIGVIAQDVEKQFPRLVTETAGHKQVNYGALLAMALEELRKKNAEKIAA